MILCSQNTVSCTSGLCHNTFTQHDRRAQNGTTGRVSYPSFPFLLSSYSLSRLAANPKTLWECQGNIAYESQVSSATMHLTTVHTGSYYSAPPTNLNMTQTPHCFNTSMVSRITRGLAKCACLNGTNTTHPLPTGIAPSPAFATLYARNIDSRDSQGLSAAAITGIIVAIIAAIVFFSLVVSWAIKSHRIAYEASGRRRCQTRSRHNGHSGNGHSQRGAETSTCPQAPGAFMGAGSQASGSLRSPPRAYSGGRGTGPRFPGPRNGYVSAAPSGSTAPPGSRGPYADGSAHSAEPVMEQRGVGRSARGHYIS